MSFVRAGFAGGELVVAGGGFLTTEIVGVGRVSVGAFFALAEGFEGVFFVGGGGFVKAFEGATLHCCYADQAKNSDGWRPVAADCGDRELSNFFSWLN